MNKIFKYIIGITLIFSLLGYLFVHIVESNGKQEYAKDTERVTKLVETLENDTENIKPNITLEEALKLVSDDSELSSVKKEIQHLKGIYKNDYENKFSDLSNRVFEVESKLNTQIEKIKEQEKERQERQEREEREEREKLKEEAEKKSKSKESSSSSSSSVPSKPKITVDNDKANYGEVDYNSWNHDEVAVNTKVRVYGKVLQAMEDRKAYTLRVAINDDYDKIILVSIPSEYNNRVIAEDDHITLYGLVKGRQSYETIFKETKTLPLMVAYMYEN